MSPEVIEFGDIKLDLQRVEILRSGCPVPVEPKTFDVLKYLVEHRDKLVTKEELLDAVWKDTFVTPNVLTRAVAQLRKAIGDDAFEARYIETVAKRGYRFIAPVNANGASVTISTHDKKPYAAAPWLLVVSGLAILVVVIVAGLAVKSRSSADAPASERTDFAKTPDRLTAGSASYTYPSMSPDGHSVAYASDQTGSMEICVVGLAPGSREVAITSDGSQNMEPAFSPNGQWLAYHSRAKGGVWVVPATGGTPRRLIEFGSSPAWSPDSTALVFTSDAGGLAAQAQLWIVRFDGTDAKPLTTLGNPAGGHTGPAWSHDGRHILFAVGQGAQSSEVWMVPASGGVPISLGAAAMPAWPRFAPDDRAAFWIRQTAQGSAEIVRLNLSVEGKPEGTPRVALSLPGNLVGSFSMAQNGMTALALFRRVGNILTVDVARDGSTSEPLALTSDDVRNTVPDFTPDGRISYQQEVSGRPVIAWLMDGDGKNREVLSTGTNISVWQPQWTSDPRRALVVVSERRDKPPFHSTSYYAWIDVATRQLTRVPLPFVGAGSLTSLSPDGRDLVFHVIDGGGVLNIWTQSLTGGPRRQLTFDREAIGYPAISPDGKWIAVEIKRSDSTHVGVLPSGGGAVEQLTSMKGQSWTGGWAPDNDRIVFAGERGGIWNIYSVSKTTKEVKPLTRFTSPDGYVRYPKWSPQGTRVVFERAERKSSLWTVNLLR